MVESDSEEDEVQNKQEEGDDNITKSAFGALVTDQDNPWSIQTLGKSSSANDTISGMIIFSY